MQMMRPSKWQRAPSANDENEYYSKVAEGDGDSEDSEVRGDMNSLVRGNDKDTQVVFAMASQDADVD